MDKKLCVRCNEIKPRSEFFKVDWEKKFKPHCKKCTSYVKYYDIIPAEVYMYRMYQVYDTGQCPHCKVNVVQVENKEHTMELEGVGTLIMLIPLFKCRKCAETFRGAHVLIMEQEAEYWIERPGEKGTWH